MNFSVSLKSISGPQHRSHCPLYNTELRGDLADKPELPLGGSFVIDITALLEVLVVLSPLLLLNSVFVTMYTSALSITSFIHPANFEQGCAQGTLLAGVSRMVTVADTYSWAVRSLNGNS